MRDNQLRDTQMHKNSSKKRAGMQKLKRAGGLLNKTIAAVFSTGLRSSEVLLVRHFFRQFELLKDERKVFNQSIYM